MSRRSVSPKLLVVTLLFAFAAFAQAVKLNVSFNGTKVGTADFTLKRLPNGGIKTIAVMNISTQGFNATITSIGEYDKTGRPIKESNIQKTPGGTRSVEVTFGSSSAKAKVVQGGKTTTKTVQIPKGKKLNRPSHFWFFRDMPKAGAVDTGLHFDLETLKFVTESEKYVGPEKITVGGKAYTAHKTTHKEGTMWVDSKGMPIKMALDLQGTKMLLERG